MFYFWHFWGGGQGCQVPTSLHCHFNPKPRPLGDLSRPPNFSLRPLSRPLYGHSQPLIFHGHLTFSTATFEQSGRGHGHLATLVGGGHRLAVIGLHKSFINSSYWLPPSPLPISPLFLADRPTSNKKRGEKGHLDTTEWCFSKWPSGMLKPVFYRHVRGGSENWKMTLEPLI